MRGLQQPRFWSTALIHCKTHQRCVLQPELIRVWKFAKIRLTIFNGKFLIPAGKMPDQRMEKAAAQRVAGRNQAVASKNSFCCWLFIMMAMPCSVFRT